MIGYGCIALIIISISAYFWPNETNAKYTYATEKIAMGALTVTVSATGKLRPTNQVEVGSVLSGIVDSVFVDENDVVKVGQVLARLDTSKLSDEVEKSRASLIAREAAVAQSRLRTTLLTRAPLVDVRGCVLGVNSPFGTALVHVSPRLSSPHVAGCLDLSLSRLCRYVLRLLM